MKVKVLVASVQFSSVAQSRPTLCDPMNRSTPGLPVHHQLPELTQTHVHRVGDAIQPTHPLIYKAKYLMLVNRDTHPLIKYHQKVNFTLLTIVALSFL